MTLFKNGVASQFSWLLITFPMENDWGFAPFSEPSVPLMPEVLMELCLLIGTDATTPFIQEQCHDFLAGFYGSPNWRFLMDKSSTNGGFLLTIYIYITHIVVIKYGWASPERDTRKRQSEWAETHVGLV